MLQFLHDLMNDEQTTYRNFVKETLTSIDAQVKSTNGRVRTLENWRWFISGGLAILALIVVPLLIYVIERGI